MKRLQDNRLRHMVVSAAMTALALALPPVFHLVGLGGKFLPMELHVYDAQHAFCNDKRPEVYNADAAALAWKRTVEFIRQHTE